MMLSNLLIAGIAGALGFLITYFGIRGFVRRAEKLEQSIDGVIRYRRAIAGQQQAQPPR